MQTRRKLIGSGLALGAAWPFAQREAYAQDSGDASIFVYRDFTVDASVLQDDSDRDAVIASLRHQLDIVADCGARPEIIAFFRSQRITLKAAAGDSGKFNSNDPGVTINAAVQAAEKPIVLHELLHAYHFRVLPERFANPDILHFYQMALDNNLYKAGAYVTKNVQEYFAVTGSLYLWGNVDRPPFNRDTLKARQPEYYAWLGQLFGVVK